MPQIIAPTHGCILEAPDERDFNAELILSSGENQEPLPKRFRVSKTQPYTNQRWIDSCFRGDTLVLMEDLSYKEIKNVRVGDVVITHTGNKKAVTEIMKNKWQGNAKTITLQGDFRSIESTLNHPFYAIKRTEKMKKSRSVSKFIESETPDFYPVKDLEVGDWVACPINNIIRDTTTRIFERDPDFLFVLGLYLAEGSTRPGSVVFTLNAERTDLFDRIKNTMEKYGTNVTLVEKHASNCNTVYVYGNDWVEVFENLGSKLCHNKKINTKLMQLDPTLQQHIIDGYCEGDGHKDGNRMVVVSTSKELLSQIKVLLLRQGIFSSFYKRKERDGRMDAYNLEWQFQGKQTNKFCFTKENYLFVRIKEVSTDVFRGGNVYNLEVEDDHSYIVYNSAVHNCVGHAVAGAKSQQENMPLSPRFVWQKGRELRGWVGAFESRYGAYITDALKAVCKYGVPLYGLVEEDPSAPGVFMTREEYLRPEYTKEQLLEAEAFRALTYWRVAYGTNGTIETLKRALFEYDTEIVTSMTWHQEFNKPRNGVLPSPKTPSDGHAFRLVGWDTKGGRERLIFANSWGVEWGDQGDFYVYTDKFSEYDFRSFFMFTDIPKDQALIINQYQGQLIKNPWSPKVYIVSNKHISWIENENIFNWGANVLWEDWSDIITVEDIEIVGTDMVNLGEIYE